MAYVCNIYFNDMMGYANAKDILEAKKQVFIESEDNVIIYWIDDLQIQDTIDAEAFLLSYFNDFKIEISCMVTDTCPSFKKD